MIKIEIKNRWTGEVIYTHECEDNTIRKTVEQAVKRGVSLDRASLYGASLDRASLDGANGNFFVPLACPSDGAFIGWKKVKGMLVKLLIPEDARRSSATTNKCRCDKAQVLAITDTDGNNPIDKITNYEYEPCDYIVGETVTPDSFDEDRWNECSHGIHFFINKQEAINY